MFTGIIEAIGVIKTKSGSRLVISRPSQFNDLKLGSSVSVSGVCLSVVTLSKKEMAFDVVPETFAKTKLGQMKVGDSVNLERALEKGGRFDGHMVQGHCEGVGEVVSVEVSSSGGNYSSLREVAAVSSIPRPLPPEEEGRLVLCMFFFIEVSPSPGSAPACRQAGSHPSPPGRRAPTGG